MYTKVILSGNTAETYVYENEPYAIGGTKKKDACKPNNDLLEADQQDLRTKTRRQDNIRRARLSFKRLLLSNIDRFGKPLLFTLTYAENETSIEVSRRAFSVFTQDLRTLYKTEIRYIAIIEFQKRGAVHFHALFWGLPPYLALYEREFRTIARVWKKGFVDIIQTDGNEKLATYLSKYLGKGTTDTRLFGHKAYICSRNIVRPIVQRGTFPLSTFLEANDINNNPQFTKTFGTPWLGKCDYRVYKLSTIN